MWCYVLCFNEWPTTDASTCSAYSSRCWTSTPAVSKKIQPVPIGLMVSLLKNHTTLYGLLFTIYNVQRMNIHLQSTRLISLFIYHLVDHYLTPKRNLQSPCIPCRLLSGTWAHSQHTRSVHCPRHVDHDDCGTVCFAHVECLPSPSFISYT